MKTLQSQTKASAGVKAARSKNCVGFLFNSLVLTAALVAIGAPVSAQPEIVAMGMPRIGASRLGALGVQTLINRGNHGNNISGHNGRSVRGKGAHAAAPKIERGAYTKLEWVKAKEKATDAALAAQKAAANHKLVVKPSHLITLPQVQPSSSRTIAPGVSYKVYAGKTRINLIDVNMSVSPLIVRPVPASSTFHALKDVHDHVRDSGAIAAINANYFKGNGTPLGTLMLDGEWLAGPLYSRVALGFTDGGYARIARVGLHGVLHTSIPGHQSLWINNINQPRSSGSHCVLYTRRWGDHVTLPYEGTLIGVDSHGEVMDINARTMAIPYGGFVLADSKKSAIAVLSRGDKVNANWSITPKEWQNVTHAISGGPLLLKDGKIAFDLKGEKFPASWTGAKITRRTACGITADDHLLMATFEGPHTLFDVAKFFLKNNCTEALNLDGGGSTTMVVNGTTVTRNATASQRRVAVALGLFAEDKAKNLAANSQVNYRPQANISSLIPESRIASQSVQEASSQLQELCPVASKSIPEIAISAIAEKIVNTPYQAPVVDIVEEETNKSFTLGQLDVPLSSSPKSITRSVDLNIKAPPVSTKVKTESAKSAKLNPDFGKRLFKGFFGR